MSRVAIALPIAAILAALFGLPRTAPAAPAAGLAPRVGCGQLATASLDAAVGAHVQLTRAVEGEFDGGRYCSVAGTIAPAIQFEARLPVAGWSGRYLQTGCGGLCGMLRIHVEHADACVPIQDHAVVLASTDMGHSGMGGAWAAANPAARADFGYRGVHLTAVAVKALIQVYYGQGPHYSYFSGCSDGGREALIEAQRFPADFDGIAAGAPALNFTVQNSFYHAWNTLANTGPDGRAVITGAELPLLHAAVLAQCDAIDGSSDGVLEDPRACHVDVDRLACAPGRPAGQCLTPAQVATVKKIYAGAQDAAGRRLVMGGPMPGSELAWLGVSVPRGPGDPIPSRRFVEDSVPWLYYDPPLPEGWRVSDLKFDAATLQSFRLRGLYDATDPDLSVFRAHGGKLLLWHGWSDQHISPRNSIGYYEAVAGRFGRAATAAFARLFLLPGVYHCSDGEGPVNFDVLTPLMAWVEQGQAPATLEQYAADSRRPVYPYPDRAARKADGSWRRVQGSWQSLALDWHGAGFFSSGYELDCDAGRLAQCKARAAAP